MRTSAAEMFKGTGLSNDQLIETLGGDGGTRKGRKEDCFLKVLPEVARTKVMGNQSAARGCVDII